MEFPQKMVLTMMIPAQWACMERKEWQANEMTGVQITKYLIGHTLHTLKHTHTECHCTMFIFVEIKILLEICHSQMVLLSFNHSGRQRNVQTGFWKYIVCAICSMVAGSHRHHQCTIHFPQTKCIKGHQKLWYFPF